YLDRSSIKFVDKEVFTDVTAGETYEVDLLIESKFREQSYSFLIHIENQSYNQTDFNKRMFRYFARLHEKFDLPIYPIVIFSYERPIREASTNYVVDFPDRQVLQFNFATVQLNRLNWRDFLKNRNPVAAALMAKMKIAPSDRPQVKLECLRLLATLKLDSAKTKMISGFVDSYLKLNEQEEKAFQSQINQIESEEKEIIMAITTSWKEEGIKEGRKLELIESILEILKFKSINLTDALQLKIEDLEISQLKELRKASLEFDSLQELQQWLDE
ncbi:MAG: Rpn family recombination-promoting nuclease/putative transposase, partial [Waterburya sp.]